MWLEERMMLIPILTRLFETVSSDIIIDKLMKYKLDKWTTRWTENCWFSELMGCDLWDEIQLQFSHWDWHWDKYYLTSSLMTWMMGQCILRSLQMTQNCDASDGYAASQTAWRNAPTGNSWAWQTQMQKSWAWTNSHASAQAGSWLVRRPVFCGE